MTFRPARCPNCAGDLQLPDNVDVVKCMYCGVSVVVRDAIQQVAAGNTKNWLMLANTAAEAGNYSEAYDYCTRILEVDPTNSEAWAGKAAAAGWLSTLASFRLPEMLAGFQKAVEYSDPEKQSKVKVVAANQICKIVDAYYRLSRQHLNEFITVDNVWNDYLLQCDLMMTALETARTYCPDEPSILDYLIYIYRDNIQGVLYVDPFSPNGLTQRVKTLSPQYEERLRSKLTYYVTKKRELDPSYQPEAINKAKASTCFVATATLGSEDHPKVNVLRDFRDEFLARQRMGRAFVIAYYRCGPFLAHIIQKSSLLRSLVRVFVVSPACWVASKYLNEPDKPSPTPSREGR